MLEFPKQGEKYIIDGYPRVIAGKEKDSIIYLLWCILLGC